MTTRNKTLSTAELLMTGAALAAASVSPLAFDWSAGSALSFHWLGQVALLPALGMWIAIIILAAAVGWRRLATAGMLAVIAGVLATAAMEVIRITGFRLFEAMAGSLPMLIGVLLTDRFMEGPDMWSNLLGWGDHVWNGVGFAFIYVALFGRLRWWAGLIYGFVIATIFMAGPVMNIIGAGPFGQDFAPIKFPLTVYLAHAAYGGTVGYIVQQTRTAPNHLLHDFFGLRLPSAFENRIAFCKHHESCGEIKP